MRIAARSLPIRKDLSLRRAATLLALFLVLFAFWYFVMPSGIDFCDSLRPATLALLSGRNPYSLPLGFQSPPWSALPLLPFALLPERLGAALVSVASFLAFGYVARRWGASRLTLTLLMLSPQVLCVSWNANVDWLVALGLIMPPPVGLFFVLAKPQIGAAVALYWFVTILGDKGWRPALATFAPITLAFALSFPVYGNHILSSAGRLSRVPWNWASWPASLPVGFVLAMTAVRRRDLRLAVLASPFLAPYCAFYSLSVPLLALVSSPLEMLAGFVGLWVYDLVGQGFFGVLLRYLAGGFPAS